jgi:F-type H+-transporting ATPase subunit epsilon
MSDATMQVELVAADRLVWSGEATMVIARTTEGDVGILPNHAPMLSLMVDGVVDVTTADDETWIAAVDAGFLSVAGNRISILAEHAEMSHDIDLEKARHDLERAEHNGENSDGAHDDVERERDAARAWAQARIRAAEKRS